MSGYNADAEKFFALLQSRLRTLLPSMGTSKEHLMLTLKLDGDVRVEIIANKYIGKVVTIGVTDPKLKTHVNLSLVNKSVESVDIFDGYVSSYSQYPTVETAIEVFIDKLCLTVSTTKPDYVREHGRDVCV